MAQPPELHQKLNEIKKKLNLIDKKICKTASFPQGLSQEMKKGLDKVLILFDQTVKESTKGYQKESFKDLNPLRLRAATRKTKTRR